jgi:hypothetical protein
MTRNGTQRRIWTFYDVVIFIPGRIPPSPPRKQDTTSQRANLQKPFPEQRRRPYLPWPDRKHSRTHHKHIFSLFTPSSLDLKYFATRGMSRYCYYMEPPAPAAGDSTPFSSAINQKLFF